MIGIGLNYNLRQKEMMTKTRDEFVFCRRGAPTSRIVIFVDGIPRGEGTPPTEMSGVVAGL